MSPDIQDTLTPISRFRPVSWEQIPDLGLYMDQVVTFITRAYEPLYGCDIHNLLSPSMINNYVKSQLIPRPTGKKYSREQIALLTMIVALKQTCSMEDIRKLLACGVGQSVEGLYDAFCLQFSQVIRAMCGDTITITTPRSALDFAILASGYSAGCATLLKADGIPVRSS